MSYTITNTRGTVVTTVPDVSINTVTPLTLIGRGVSGYGQFVANDLYHLLENYAAPTPVNNPVTGMLWYDMTPLSESMRFWNGSAWMALATTMSGADVMLDREDTANAVDFSVSGPVKLHTGAPDMRTIVTSILILPRAGASVSDGTPPVSFSLEVADGSSDISDKIVMNGLKNADSFGYYTIQGVNRIVRGGDEVKLVIDQPVSASDTLIADVFLFGHIRS